MVVFFEFFDEGAGEVVFGDDFFLINGGDGGF